MSFIIQLEEPNFEGKNENVFKALPTGDYQAMVTDCKIQNTKTNRPQLVVSLKLVGEKRLQGAMLDGRKETYRLLLDTKYTSKMLNDLLYAVGFNIKGAVDVSKMVEQNALVGKMCYAHLVESSYMAKDGSTKPCNEVKWLNKQPKNTFTTSNGEDFQAIKDDEIPF